MGTTNPNLEMGLTTLRKQWQIRCHRLCAQYVNKTFASFVRGLDIWLAQVRNRNNTQAAIKAGHYNDFDFVATQNSAL